MSCLHIDHFDLGLFESGHSLLQTCIDLVFDQVPLLLDRLVELSDRCSDFLHLISFCSEDFILLI